MSESLGSLNRIFADYRQSERGAIEARLYQAGIRYVGVDEVGRGCLAGPVFSAAATILPDKAADLDPRERALIRDSKTLSARQRQRAVELLDRLGTRLSIAWASSTEIDQLGIVAATHLSMLRALQQHQESFDLVLVDGSQKIQGLMSPQMSLVKGDNLCYSIAAASIAAKQARDHLMQKLAEMYPHYGFEQNVGYGTAKHLEGLKQNGICAIHRKSFAPVAQAAARSAH